MPHSNQQEGDLERRARELARKIDEVEDAQGSKKFVESKDLEETLKEVDSHVVLPRARYKVNFGITVHPEGVLEIEPGTEIHFGYEAGIISYGTLNAIGTEEDRILFTASQDRWGNITLVGKSASASILEHCQISKGSGRGKIPATDYFGGIDEPYSSKEKLGGGLLIANSDVTIRYCQIQNNKALDGGGLTIVMSKPVMDKNTITNNEADENGGGVTSYNSCFTLKGNEITDNKAGRYGGGLYLHESNPTLERNAITHNQAKFGGGSYFWKSNPTLEENKITENKAEWGGGLILAHSSPTLRENKITYNRSNKWAGGILIGRSDPTLEWNIITDNKAEIGGGLCIYKSNPVLRENTIKRNIGENIFTITEEDRKALSYLANILKNF